jgi:hypothetical protein
MVGNGDWCGAAIYIMLLRLKKKKRFLIFVYEDIGNPLRGWKYCREKNMGCR